ncbi:MAG: glutamate-5-semialdehyde dehydrogenase [Eubacteriales bacterium]|nr:glutamate-5-semialdehyde dehydrogenase [Eubacterium sp.]MDD7180310.1 glutamate-5-semialdehyde dehydrogenase [Eubacterium sp.]MDY5492978.1 glutamate-5-semialdehyde dehydrogenase [Eubacteriales bacterium]
MQTQEILIRAKNAAKEMHKFGTDDINLALEYMADALIENTDVILSKNKIDVDAARGKISDVMIDRLALDESRINGMAKGILDVAKLPSPVGNILDKVKRPNGLIIEKISVPMGVIAIIYESRPNVTSDAASLALKSGNVCILRGGKEAYNSSKAITEALRYGLEKAGLPKDAVQMVDDISRESAKELMLAKGYVDLLIPRGGAGLIRTCVENAVVPCIETGTGICHIYIDKDADFSKALSIVENAKTSRPSVCNAAEVCLVHKNIASEFLPLLKKRLVDDRAEKGLKPVILKCDTVALNYIDATQAESSDFDTEFLDYIMAVKVVDSAQDAVEHIAAHSTAHSEAIITENKTTADYFLSNVDSAAVYVNASTRFTDGGEFGLGCEMGISTQKLHARGPIGLRELTTYKYIIHGNGQIR